MLKGYSTCTTTKDLKDIEANLKSDYFLRVHRSYLVNLMHVERISGSFSWLHMKDGHTIPVSRWKRKYVKEMLDLI
jgi:DNA-binding LytR/AlgR family response regulator